jgi:hypothetical protein
MHAFLPNGNNNPMIVHGTDMGPALPVEHDYVHFNQDIKDIANVCNTKEKQEHYLQIVAIIANACARAGNPRAANRLIDQLNNLGYTLAIDKEPVIKEFMINTYKELAYFAGMNDVTVELKDFKNNTDHSFTYTIEVSVVENAQKMTFKGTMHDVFSREYETAKIQNIETLYQHLQQIQQMKPSSLPSTLPSYINDINGVRHEFKETVIKKTAVQNLSNS